MRFQLLISCNNEAFGALPWEHRKEVARILEQAALNVDNPNGPVIGREHPVRDINGNTVGTWAFIADGEGLTDSGVAAALGSSGERPWK